MEPDNIPTSRQLNPMEEIELGKALCDRLGLNHGTTLREWSSESVSGGKKVAITMTSWAIIDLDEFEDLQAVAAQRTAAIAAAAATAAEVPMIVPEAASADIPAAPETKPEGTSK